MTLSLPRFQQAAPLVDENGTPSTSFHIWWDTFAGNLELAFNDLATNVAAIDAAQAAADAAALVAAGAQADATAALAQLIDIASDNLLTPGEKPVVIKDRDAIINDQTDLDAKATSYGITTEKTNYDTAITALTTYLATLTTPVLWSNLTGNTTIVGTTFRSKFLDVYSTKQLLINKITAAAKVLADAAQTQANTATTNAATAQTTANTGVTNAATAQTAADTVGRRNNVSASATDPTTILTGHDAGTDADIIIANHTRLYDDGTSVSITGTTLHGLVYSTLYAIYYDDPTLVGGAVTFHATATLKDAKANKTTGRHYCGQVTTPAGGAGDSSGSGQFAPGGNGPFP